jgi:hypothetical protein
LAAIGGLRIWPALALRALIPVGLLAAGGVLAQAPPPAAFPGQPPPSPPADILLFDAETLALDEGTALQLRWEAINAYELAIEPDIAPSPSLAAVEQAITTRHSSCRFRRSSFQ